MEEDMTLLYESADGLTLGFDSNNDGIIDTIEILNDPTGISGFSVLMDTDSNGTFDVEQSYMDLDFDGYAESMMISKDYDGDGNPDMMKMFADENLDGDFDSVTTYHADNTPGQAGYRVEYDYDFDADHNSDYHYEEFIPLDSPFASYAYNSSMAGDTQASLMFDPSSTPAEYVSGTPASDMEVWEWQGFTNRCALYAQKFAIEELTGQEIDIEEFASIAEDNGWFNDGTTFLNMDKMLSYYDVDHSMSFDANIESLEKELQAGNKIIVSVDADQIWNNTGNDIFSPNTQANHALQVIGIDRSNPDEPMAILNDSGSVRGRGEMVPLKVFDEAWSTGDRQMIVCYA